MPLLNISLFGTPRVAADGDFVTFDRNKPLALLAYLAMTNRTHTRTSLSLLFWPESANARTHLRSTLLLLRRAFGDNASHWLVDDHTSVKLSAGADVAVDSLDFRKIVDTIKAHDHGGGPFCDQCRREAETASDLYHGEFLAGLALRDAPEFDVWLTTERESLHLALAWLVAGLTDTYAAVYDWESAISHAQRWLLLDPLDEAAHRKLMYLYAWSDRRTLALRQYEECARIIRTEFDAPPDKETEALVDAIRRGELKAVAQPQLRATPPKPRVAHTINLRASPMQRIGHNKGLLDVSQRLRRTDVRLHNLPAFLTPFIGREGQIAYLVQLLQTKRLLTLTGSGGVGKTRLAIAVAAMLQPEFEDGVWFVDLASLVNPDAIPHRILDLWRVPEQPESSPSATLMAYLGAKHLLLILDNCEHLVGACATLVERILYTCPGITLLATSREALNIPGETPWRVPSLTRPSAGQRQHDRPADAVALPTPEELLRFEATALFVERAQRHWPAFELTSANAAVVAHICSRLDGIPLALEMAAARVNVFTVEEMAARLDGAFDTRFQFLTNGVRTAPLRHQTLRATLEWSYALLSADEQQLLLCLSAFSGGWTSAAAEAVTGCSPDLLAQLVNKSLVIADQQGGQTRYRLLETVRQFAAEQFNGRDEHHQCQQRHSRYYLHLLGVQEPRLAGPQQRNGLEIIRADFANMNSAWYCAVEHGEFDLLAPATQALYLFCDATGNYRTGVTLFSQAVAEIQKGVARSDIEQSGLCLLFGQLLNRLGACEVRVCDFVNGEQHLHECLSWTTAQNEQAFALRHLGIAAAEQGEIALKSNYVQRSLALSQSCNDVAGMADALLDFHQGTSDHSDACRQGSESLALWRQVGRPDRIAGVLGSLAWHIWCTGSYTQADLFWREGVALCEQLDLPNEKAWMLDCIGFAAWCEGNEVEAEYYIREALSIYTMLGRQASIGMCKAELALVLSSVGRSREAIALGQEAVAVTRAVNSQMMLTISLNYLGATLTAAVNLTAARGTLLEAVELAWKHQFFFILMTGLYYFAELLIAEIGTDYSRPSDRQTLAMSLLAFVQTQDSAWHFYRKRAAKLQTEIEHLLSIDLRTAAIRRGSNATAEEMVAVVLASTMTL